MRQFIFITFFFISLIGTAQKTVQKQHLYWYRYYNQLQLNKHLVWHNEIENRRFLPDNVQHHFIAHSHLHFNLNKRTEVAVGTTYSRQSPQIPNSELRLVVPEIRPFQEIMWSDAITKKLSLQHRIRIEERFVHKSSPTQLLDGRDFSWRFRYRLLLSRKLSNKDTKLPLTGRIGTELFMNAGKRIIQNQFDQFRVFGVLEQRISKNFSAELTYMHWYQQRSTGTQFFSRNIGRLTLVHRVEMKHKH